MMKSAGIGIREDGSLITKDTLRFIPHYIAESNLSWGGNPSSEVHSFQRPQMVILPQRHQRENTHYCRRHHVVRLNIQIARLLNQPGYD